jgi:hypothetical protein
LHEKINSLSVDMGTLRRECSALQDQVSTLSEKLSDQEKLIEENRDLNDIPEKFKSMQISSHWVRAVVALSLIEAAMKLKLEHLGKPVKPNTPFGEPRAAAEQAISDLEKRKLRPRLLRIERAV